MITGIVGLDLSITGSGVVRYSAFSGTFTFIDTIGTDAKFGHMIERMEYSAKKIIEIIDADDLFFIEDYAYGVKKEASKLATLGEINGIIKFLIYRRTGKPAIEVSSTVIKQWLSGKGNLKKEDFKLAAYKKYDREFKTQDEVIAYSLADLGTHLLYPPQRKLLKYEEEVLKNFKKKHENELAHICRGDNR